MKFTYAYKTSDGIRHEDAMEAGSREEVFEALRTRGIKAIKVVAADGSKANGEIVVKGLRKRVAFGIAVAVACIAGGFAYMVGRDTGGGQSQGGDLSAARPRHWIGRDITAEFAHPSERLLAQFAQPGVPVDESALPPLDERLRQDLFAALKDGMSVRPGEDERVTDLRRVVEELKQEAAVHLRGGADLPSLVAFLVQRQRMEAALRDKLISDLVQSPESERAQRRRSADEMMATMGFEPIGEAK